VQGYLVKEGGVITEGPFVPVDPVSRVPVYVLTDASIVDIDTSNGPLYELTISGNRTLGNPVNNEVGRYLEIVVHQDNLGGRTLGFGSDWVNAGTVYQVAQGANSTSVIKASARGNTTKWYYEISHSEVLVSSATVTANQIAWDPTGRAWAEYLLVSSFSLFNIQGIKAPVFPSERFGLDLTYIGSSSLVIKHEDAGALPSNRVVCPGGVDLALTENDILSIRYDRISGRWRVV
jgi:hypothetical protein